MLKSALIIGVLLLSAAQAYPFRLTDRVDEL